MEKDNLIAACEAIMNDPTQEPKLIALAEAIKAYVETQP